MNDRHRVWEDILEEAVTSWEMEPEAAPAHTLNPTEWVVDCMMGCYNFTDPEEA
ncbi:hypothetical protein [Thermoflexus sp.]|uniref:hypothetical protein n=1 Tax=Thermoflexus sp. TaxID=1969742 RepID=UPI0025FC3858|nr:hypothetical protein [Thermoflexus sp.]MDW8180853.1 hypothetical protein [Anaerolineae bacterium]MCS6964751.1 hypothetical protein [Thermoflexus sp.]MCS7351397.1 hypothetical protein [Thermoflexus sp.]MCX7689301.1 hypothetical protein [Thermoflexus sp.]MDW8184074.1 hypothetical protein [Anaerolineae bacterium]